MDLGSSIVIKPGGDAKRGNPCASEGNEVEDVVAIESKTDEKLHAV